MAASAPLRRPSPSLGVSAGAAFLMATSAIGPGFLTQTAVFTERLGVDFAFVILASLLIGFAAQVNVWRVLGVARRRGQELASALVPGLGTALAVLVAFGGLAFNVGNIAGGGMGLEVLGVPPRAGAALTAVFSIVLLARPTAGRAMDRTTQALGGLMILLTLWVMLVSGPDYGGALRAAVLPGRIEFLPIVTLVGGTVGGYITFSGIHRLLDAGLGGEQDAAHVGRASLAGILITAVMRVLVFLAVLGVVLHEGGRLDPANPPASAFRLGGGEWGYRLFGVVLWSASATSVIGCSYTSLSFLRTLAPAIERRMAWALTAFIGASLAIYLVVERPVTLLILAGALNGLILPVTLGVVLVACRRRDLMGGYRHPPVLQAVGWAAWVVSVAAGVLSLQGLAQLWAGG
jgi:Mn2+/Fe2+ NRAMP family transporter